MRFILYYIIAFSSCNSNSKPVSESIKVSNKISSEIDSSINEPIKTVIDFLKWYRDHFTEIKEIVMVNNYPTDNLTKYYSINFKGTEKYLNELINSGFISNDYIIQWRKYFNNCESNFKNNPQNDGSPEGFEYDFIMWTQEYEEDLANIEHTKVIQKLSANNKINLIIEFPSKMRIRYLLSINKNNWLIDDIRNELEK